MKTITTTKARSDLFNIVKDIVKGHQEVKITSKEGSVVLVSEQDYENLMETLELMSVSGLTRSIHHADKDIENGDTISIDEAFK